MIVPLLRITGLCWLMLSCFHSYAQTMYDDEVLLTMPVSIFDGLPVIRTGLENRNDAAARKARVRIVSVNIIRQQSGRTDTAEYEWFGFTRQGTRYPVNCPGSLNARSCEDGLDRIVYNRDGSVVSMDYSGFWEGGCSRVTSYTGYRVGHSYDSGRLQQTAVHTASGSYGGRGGGTERLHRPPDTATETTTYAYNARGLISLATHYGCVGLDGRAAKIAVIDQVTRYDYDAQDRLIHEIRYGSYYGDLLPDNIARVPAADAAKNARMIAYAYGVNGLLHTCITIEHGDTVKTERFMYDAANRLTTWKKSSSELYDREAVDSFSYDEHGHVISYRKQFHTSNRRSLGSDEMQDSEFTDTYDFVYDQQGRVFVFKIYAGEAPARLQSAVVLKYECY